MFESDWTRHTVRSSSDEARVAASRCASRVAAAALWSAAQRGGYLLVVKRAILMRHAITRCVYLVERGGDFLVVSRGDPYSTRHL
jgi:hypothetical protein